MVSVWRVWTHSWQQRVGSDPGHCPARRRWLVHGCTGLCGFGVRTGSPHTASPALLAPKAPRGPLSCKGRTWGKPKCHHTNENWRETYVPYTVSARDHDVSLVIM